MADFFSDYQLLAQSGLFDAAFYVATYPDVASARVDPLSHYLETGAIEMRNPSATFDARDYAERCLKRGERIDNPLLHYIKTTAAQGLAPPRRRDADAGRFADTRLGDGAKVQCFCELLEVTQGGRVSVMGWIMAAAATERIAVLLDGEYLGDARIGIERPDVGGHFPGLAHARRAGFSFRQHVSKVGEGQHLVTLQHLAGGDQTEILLTVLAAAGSDLERAQDPAVWPQDGDLLLSIDLPQAVDGVAVSPVRNNLEIAGWALARRGIDTLEVAIDGVRMKSFSTGIRRIDVQRAYPDWEGALTAGFSTLLPHRSLPGGAHTVAIVLRDQTARTTRAEFRIFVEDAPDADGPWALRRRMRPAEMDLLCRPFRAGVRQPSFDAIVPLPKGAKALKEARTTLASFAAQEYETWRVRFVSSTQISKASRHALLAGFEKFKSRVDWVCGAAAVRRPLGTGAAGSHLMVLKAGDELGCDALLEFGLQAVLDPRADFIYSDERRMSPTSGRVEAFFKPQWSPDLLLATNYLGRAWCVRMEVVDRAGITAKEFTGSGYHLVLRLTECAQSIRHVPATLVQCAGACAEDGDVERKAIGQALARRGIAAAVEPGRTETTHRVRRALLTDGLVSIIIPTRAARGLIRTCLETLHARTAYRHFEIVCIENIPREEQEWKRWLRAHATQVLEIDEPFNWSRYNNLAVTASRGEFLVFLNDDVEITDPNWLGTLLEHAQRPEVGVVGPQLLYPDGAVQHAGMFLAGSGVARHAFRGASADDPGYFGLAVTDRNVIAVTGACMMMRRNTFDALGGFDETHMVVNNDLDFCLRLRKKGLRTLYTPHTSLIHHELASRSEILDNYDSAAFESRWRGTFAAGDPFFHPRLTKDRDDYSIEWEATDVRCAGNPVLRRETIRRILIVKLDHIGDCVIAMPAIRRLKGHFPDAGISVLSGRASKAIWALEPAIDEVIEFDFFHARSGSGLTERSEADWRELRERLLPQRFDLAIDLRRHWETRPVLEHTGARYLAGFDTQGRFPWLDIAIESFEDSALLRKRQHATDDLVNLIDAVAAAGEGDRRAFSRSPARLADHALAGLSVGREVFRKRVVCVHPAAGNELRQWPTEYFTVLIDQLVETEDVHVILIGGPDETELGTRVLAASAHQESVWSLIGKLPLSQLPSLILRCALFVGNNSGPQHIAAGLGVPTVGIHSGVVDVREWGARGTSAVAIQRAMTCSPCYHSTREGCQRELACLSGLLPGEVLSACRRLLSMLAPVAHATRRKAAASVDRRK